MGLASSKAPPGRQRAVGPGLGTPSYLTRYFIHFAPTDPLFISLNAAAAEAGAKGKAGAWAASRRAPALTACLLTCPQAEPTGSAHLSPASGRGRSNSLNLKPRGGVLACLHGWGYADRLRTYCLRALLPLSGSWKLS